MTTSPVLLAYGRTTLKGNRMSDKFMVAYAKISVDKDDGISLVGVFFGGIGNTHQEAEEIARECVNTIRGSTTILPKVFKLDGDGKVIDALYDATEKFERVTQSMIETDQIVNRRKKK